MYTYPFSLPPFYISIIRCLGVLEGVAIQVDPKARIISEAYPYVASRILTDPQDELKEAFRRLAFTNDGHVRWDRLEGLLEKAKDSADYDVVAALDVMTDYLLTEEGGKLLSEFSQLIVDAADSLGTETVRYLLDAGKALAINDEVAAVRAFRSLQDVFNSNLNEEGFEGIRKKVGGELKDVLPEPTPAMQRFSKILTLLTITSSGPGSDPAKFVPIARKLSQEPRIQQTANEVIARLGERLLSRGLRAVFGLPPPNFGKAGPATTVTEDKER